MTHGIDEAIFHVSSALEVPILILALLALAVTLVEAGGFLVELSRRRQRGFAQVSRAAEAARAAFDRDDHDGMVQSLEALAWSEPLAKTLRSIGDDLGDPLAEPKIAKSLADFDFDAQRRLGRTRLLVRFGPALGLMGTLIPLSPALDGLARGNVTQLSHDLRVAFSVTVLGLLIGAIAFGLSLYRDRMYGQDLSDLEYVAAVLTADPK
ncbi:MAG TPA: MotA/TolQ/ExbB proton channel family protein [Mycobacteriales bacterium]|jgi:biopolymer transport protein ExbB/TolQ|nr:MotA/TolQ/ExbB proton channel family protein [Mycobacteriales bacterium]